MVDPLHRLGVVVATVVAAAAWAALWWLAAPRHDVCGMVLPAPAGCRIQDRLTAATIWTAVVALLYAVVVASAVARSRRLFTAGLAGLIVAAPCGYLNVLYQ